MTAVRFANNNAQFFNTLKTRVNSYFEENKIKMTGNYKLYVKTILLICFLAAIYTWLVFFTPGSILISMLLCGLMGILFAGVGFNVMHDGAHGSYSSKSWVNQMMAHSLELMGASSYLWKYKHNVAHHSFTNIQGMDEDIEILPFMRTNHGQKKYWIHRFQHIYSFLLYGLTYFAWVYLNDFRKYITRKITPVTSVPPMKLKDHIIFWSTKLSYFAIFIAIPIWKVGLLYTFIGYSFLVFICGMFIAFTFQLAHVNEDTSFVVPQGDNHLIENEWAIHQIVTTTNFATKQKWHRWFWGGLNYQIEHHLFPKISHVHYPEISKIVKQTCKEFNVAYKEFPTILSAVYSHLVYLKSLGIAK